MTNSPEGSRAAMSRAARSSHSDQETIRILDEIRAALRSDLPPAELLALVRERASVRDAEPSASEKATDDEGLASRDRARAHLAKSARLVHAHVLDSMSEGVLVTDAEGLIVFANPAEHALFGYPVGELVGKNVTALNDYPPEENARVVRAIIDHLHAHGVWTGEFENRRKDGSPFRSDARITALRIDDRDYWVSVQTDVSERHALQRKLMVADRMVSVGTLAAGIVHEINNPLAYVSLNVEALIEEVRSERGGNLSQVSARAEEARVGVQRMRDIVRSLKSFARIEPENRRPLDVRAVVELSVKLTANEIRHRARLVKELGEVPSVNADEARLGQVFTNLLVNAAQALPDGYAERHEIRVVTRTDEQGRAVIEVSDTGPGIPAELSRRVFDPFFTTKPVGSGTGLGLSICHGIVGALGGEIALESRAGRGCTFRVTLPAATDPTRAETPVPRSAQTSERRGRVLIVDDDCALGAALGRGLCRDHDVTVVESAAAALAELELGAAFDVILSDMMMPVMNGLELYERLTRVAPDQARRVVFMTGGAFTPSAQAFLEADARRWIEKPFDIESVRALVRSFVH